MPAIHSVLNHCDNTLGNHQQQDSQTYFELFPEIDNAPSNSEFVIKVLTKTSRQYLYILFQMGT